MPKEHGQGIQGSGHMGDQAPKLGDPWHCLREQGPPPWAQAFPNMLQGGVQWVGHDLPPRPTPWWKVGQALGTLCQL